MSHFSELQQTWLVTFVGDRESEKSTWGWGCWFRIRAETEQGWGWGGPLSPLQKQLLFQMSGVEEGLIPSQALAHVKEKQEISCQGHWVGIQVNFLVAGK